MAEISIENFDEKDLVILSVTGTANMADLLSALKKIGKRKPLLTNVIWDTTNGSFGDIKASDMETVAAFLKKGQGMRPGGKTAMVGPDDLNFGIARMFESYVALEDLVVEYKSFRSLEKAMAWIEKD